MRTWNKAAFNRSDKKTGYKHIESLFTKTVDWRVYKNFKRYVTRKLSSELGDISRFKSPTQLMAYLDLVPGEHSSGSRRRQGAITKTGTLMQDGCWWSRPGVTDFLPVRPCT